MKSFKTGLAGFIVAVLAFSGLFMTCEIGLGDSVDTKPPKVSITYPPVQSVIKNTFTLAGSVSDDVSDPSVAVSITNTANGAKYGPYVAAGDAAEKKWTIAVNRNNLGTFELPDGKYEITATAKDGSGRTSVASITYEIDNTPPVLVLNRPGTLGPISATEIEKYGSELKITGSANDDHAIDLLQFRAYDAAGTPVAAPLTYSNVSGVGMEILLAKYYSSPSGAEEISLDGRYRSMYTVPSGTLSYYAGVDISDEAREFNPPADVASATNTRGNVSGFYFLYDDIYSTVFADAGFGLTMKDLTAVYNGTYGTAAQRTAILAYLDTKKIDSTTWSSSAATFSLNPNNSPTYDVIGYESLDPLAPVTCATNQVSNEGKINIRLSAGRDNVPLVPDSFKVYVEPCSIDGTVAVGADQIVFMRSLAEISGDAARVSARALSISKTGSDYVLSVTVKGEASGPQIATGQNYVITVVGVDQSGYTISDMNGRYGFQVISTGAPPDINLDPSSPIDELYTKDPTSHWSGTVQTDVAFASVSARYTIQNIKTNATIVSNAPITPTHSTGGAATLENFEFDLPSGILDDDPGVFRVTLQIEASDVNGNSGSIQRRIYIDRSDPAISSFSVDKLVYVGADPYANGEITASVILSDNQEISTASYRINGGTTTAIASLPSVSIPINTRTYFAGTGTISIAFTLQDRAGNNVTVSRTIAVDQGTDRPSVTLGNLDGSVITQVAGVNQVLLGNVISGTVDDDDGISSVSLTIRDTTNAIVKNAVPATLKPGTTSRGFTYDLTSGIPLPDGLYSVVVVASDSNALPVTNVAMVPVWFSYDNNPPELTCSTPDSFAKAAFQLTGTAYDANALANTAITVTQKFEGGTAIPISANGPTTSDSWANWAIVNLPRIPSAGSIGLPAALDGTNDGLYEFVVTATDKAGKTVQRTRTVRLDTKAAGVSITTPTAGYIIGVNDSFSGTASDPVSATNTETASGVKSVRYSFNDAAAWAFWTEMAGTTNWNASVTMSGAEGPRTLYVKAEDNAGNVASTSASRAIVFDKAVPTVAVDGSERWEKALFTLSGTAVDSYGVASVSVRQNGTLISPNTATVTGTAPSFMWSIGNLPRNPLAPGTSLLADGTYVYTVQATDLAGRPSTIASLTVTVDTTAPATNAIAAPLSGQTGQNALSGAAYVFGGSTTDAGVGISKIWYAINATATMAAVPVADSPAGYGYTELATAGSWNFSKTLGAGKDIAEGKDYYLHVLAEDKAGNRTPAAADVRFDVDIANPGVAINAPFNVMDVVDRTASYALAGTITDSHGVATVTVTQKDGAGAVVTVLNQNFATPVPSYSLNLANLPWNAALAPVTVNDNYEYTVSATDAVGKITSVTRRARLDTAGPSVSVVTPANGAWSGTSDIPVTGVATDLTGVAAVYYSTAASEPAIPAVPGVIGNWTANGWDKATNTGSWNFALTALAEGEHVARIRAVDTLGNVSSSVAHLIKVDLNAPAITSNTPAANTRVLFDLSGNATDTNSVASVTMKQTFGATTVDIPVPALTGTPQNRGWSVTGLPRDSVTPANSIDMTGDDGVYNYVITVTDAAGKTSQSTQSVRFDRTKPETFSLTTPAPATFLTTWFKNQSIPMSGSVGDAGSGLASVDYSLNGTVWVPLSYTATAWSGTVIANAGTGTVYFRAMDKAGNDITFTQADVQVDASDPDLTMVTPSILAKVRADQDIAIKVIATDAAAGSGVSTVRIVKIGAVTLGTPIALSGPAVSVSPASPGTAYDGAWTGTISMTAANRAAWALTDGNQYPVVVEATDGSTRTRQVTFSFALDTTVPDVSFLAPADGGKVNRNVDISGMAGDTQGLNSVRLEIVKGGSVTATLGTFTGASAYSWSLADFDTVTYGTTAYGTTVADGISLELRATAEDLAGNTKLATRTVVVNQNSDRPVIKLSNVTVDGNTILKMTGTIYGTVTDDDGVSQFYVSENPAAWGAPLSLSGGTWSKDSSTGDGAKTIYFRVIDDKGGEFYTDAIVGGAVRGEPYVVSGASTAEAAVSYRVDNTTPTIDSSILVDKTSLFNFSDSGLLVNNAVLGGTAKTFAVALTATDANGIEDATGVTVSIPAINSTVPFPMTATFTNAPVINATEIRKGGDYQIVTGSVYSGAGGFGAANNTAGTIFTATRDGALGDVGTVRQKMYVTGTIDASGFSVEQYITLTFAVSDKSTLKTTVTRTILVDNVQPTVSFQSPLLNATVNGDIEVKGLADDGLGSGVASVKYQIGKNANLDPDSILWTNVTTGLFSWQIDFKGSGSNIDIYGNATYGTETGASTNLWSVPVVIRVADTAGNVRVTTLGAYALKVDPNGDRPKVKVTYPSPTATNRTMGGTIRIFGSAEDDDGVAKVQLQVDSDLNGTPDVSKDADGTVSWNVEINKGQEFDPDATPVNATALTAGIRYQVLTVGTSHFDTEFGAAANAVDAVFTANKDGSAGSGTGTVLALVKRINFRVRAVDVQATPVNGDWSDWYSIDVDKNIPKIGSTVSLYIENTDGVKRPYVADMWIKGDWKLKGSVEDESGIQSIAITGNIAGSLGGTNTSWFAPGEEVKPGKFNYGLDVDVDTASLIPPSGTLSFKIAVTDFSSPVMSNSVDVSFRYDNSAPTFPAGYYDASSPIVQSNKTYSMNGTVSENGSGLERVAFWFERTGSATRVYDPGITDPLTGVGTRINSANYGVVDKLPRLHLTGITAGNRTLYSLTDAALVSNPSVRIGGLVKIDGLERVITAYDNATGTISWADVVPVTANEAWVAYAQIVNNQTEETAVWNAANTAITEIKNDDGDKMIEYLYKEGADYDWTAYINSKNIPDGPIALHIVAYDKAGNVTEATVVNTSVQNKRPLISKVILGTDLNGTNGTADPGETTEYSALDGDGKEQATVRIASDAFKLKGDSTVKIEWLNGNDDIFYTLQNIAFSASKTTVPYKVSDGGSLTLMYDASATTLTVPSLTNAYLDAIAEGPRNLVFTVWDSTEELVPGNTTQYAIVTVPVVIDVEDTVNPAVVINDLYWTDATHNSVYQGLAANGHIDLSADLPAAYLATNTSGITDRDSKVSGQITLTGTAYDDQRLTDLYMKIVGFNFEKNIALVNLASDTTYVRVATRTTSGWEATGLGDIVADGWHFAVTEAAGGLGQNGHSISWTLDWDTAQVTNVAALDRTVSIIAVDRGARESSPSNAGTDPLVKAEYNRPFMKVDVVPYVREVTTSLSSLNSGNPSVFDRTAKGNYPVYETEQITLTGFNMKNGATAPTVTINGGSATVDSSSPTVLKVTVPDERQSGALLVTVGIVSNINNSNKDNSLYNAHPNNVTNNMLGDDVNIDVWEFTTVATPRDGTIMYPEMQIGPNGEIGFAFVNGNFYFNMAGPSTAGQVFAEATTNSWASQRAYEKEYAQYYESAFTFDKSGNTYGLSTNIDVYIGGGNAYSANTTLYFGQRALFNDGTAAWSNVLGNYYGGRYRRRLQSTTSYSTGALSDANPQRVQSPSLATATDGETTNLYMAFYDSTRKEVRYRYGTVGRDWERRIAAVSFGSGVTTIRTTADHGFDTGDKVTFTGVGNTYMPADARLATYTVTKVDNDEFSVPVDVSSWVSAAFYVSNVGGQLLDATGGWSTSQGISAGSTASDNSVKASMYTVVAPQASSGKYVTVGVVPKGTKGSAGDVAVIAWYDATAKALKYGYSATPQFDDAAFTVSTIESSAGWYPQIKVDQNGGIHIAYYSTATADLKYAYAAKYDDPFTIMTVDSYQLVGTQIGLDVAFDATGNVVPYISYYSASAQASKVAYPVYAVGSTNLTPSGHGAVSDKYTGAWEIAVVPTSNRTPKDDSVCIGVHKNWATGTILAIEDTIGTLTEATTDSNPSSRVGGNGTTNPVVAYTIQENDSLQMAQKN